MGTLGGGSSTKRIYVYICLYMCVYRAWNELERIGLLRLGLHSCELTQLVALLTTPLEANLVLLKTDVDYVRHGSPPALQIAFDISAQARCVPSFPR